MPRTTLNLDNTVLQQVRRLAKAQGKSLAQLVSELLAIALAGDDRLRSRKSSLSWKDKSMRARVDLEDKEAVHEALERE